MQKKKLRSIWTKVDDYHIHFRYAERKPHATPVIFIHGLGFSGNYFKPTAEYMSNFYTIYIPDLPGFGKTTKPTIALTVNEHADFIAKWMKIVKIEKAILIGNSLGCQIIVDFAARYPELLTHAVLISPMIDNHPKTLKREKRRLFANLSREPMSYLLLAMRDYIKAGTISIVKKSQHSLLDPIENKLPHVEVPTLVIRGESDPIVPQHWAEKVALLLADGRLKIIAGAAHLVNYNSPEALTREIKKFLDAES